MLAITRGSSSSNPYYRRLAGDLRHPDGAAIYIFIFVVFVFLFLLRFLNYIKECGPPERNSEKLLPSQLANILL